MTQLNHREYYVARAEASRAVALIAADEQIAKIHTEFAARYDLIADQVGSHGEPSRPKTA
ncbi:hypothetical protein EAH87_16265 [Sphingomonas koreensis]|nr:hypothetical protein EAH87_16265 [Sphingomonas koreensis]